jgi:two-component system sensor histidine kinase KdpD
MPSDSSTNVGARTSPARVPWHRADWFRAAAGFAGIAVGAFFVWGIVLHELELELPSSHRGAYAVRALTTLLTLAVWTVWQVRGEERRLAAAREKLAAEHIALQEERWRAEQAEGLAAFARILAHELRNPLNAMTLHTALVKRTAQKLGPEGEPIRAAVGVIEAQAHKVDELLESYLACARRSEVAMEHVPVKLDEVVEEAVETRRDSLILHGIHAHVHCPEALPVVRGDAQKLVQAIHHVLDNVREALPRGGRVDIRASAENGQVVLQIADDGPGFTDPDAVFRPFFTTRKAAGLGLAVVRDIVRAHRGEVGAANGGDADDPHRGARITIRLPEGDP